MDADATVHPSLHFARLTRLPPSLRLVATNAYNGKITSVERIVSLCKEGNAHAQYLLPVLFANLAPSKLPLESHMDTDWSMLSDKEQMDIVIPPLLCLDCVRNGAPIPDGALQALWPRVLAWCKFIFTYYEFIPPSERPGLYAMSTLFVGLLHRFFVKFRDGAKLLGSTPEVRALFATVWRHIFLKIGYDPDANATELQHISLFLQFDAMNSGTLPIDEYLDGLDHSPDELASIVLLHLDFAVAQLRDTSFTENLRTFITAPLTFLGYMDIDHDPFRGALRDRNGAESITKALVQLAERNIPDTEELQMHCLTLLVREMDTPAGFRQLGQNLSCGLLKGIGLCAYNLRSPTSDVVLQGWLQNLTSTTVFHSILVAFEKALPSVQTFGLGETFGSPETTALWRILVQAVHERGKVRKRFDSDDYVATAACDNVQVSLPCRQIMEKHRFRRCSGCHSANYCSVDCQRLDWNEGQHRAVCIEFRNIRQDQSCMLTTRERSFIRALLDHECASNPQISALSLSALHSNSQFHVHNPGFMVFNYTSGRPRPKVSNHPGSLVFPPSTVDWSAYYRRRFERSGGRFALHVMVLHGGGRILRLALPMRSADSRVHDRMAVLAPRFDTLTPAQVEAEVKQLMEMDVRNVH
ncbi:hypothetical protein C8R47DRAFT_1067547 [Mycena vitilis]|nr:hypothetical protein C8R47DRAFT_1067547 [Mycena vitilis]